MRKVTWLALVCLLTGGAGCCRRSGSQAKGETPGQCQYSLIAIEMKMHQLALENREDYGSSDSAMRVRLAGPTVLPELTKYLEGDDRDNRNFAGDILHHLACWPPAVDYMVARLRTTPKVPEGRALIEAMVSVEAPLPKDLQPYIAPYLKDSTCMGMLVVAHGATLRVSRYEIQPRYCACVLLQRLSGVDFGAAGLSDVTEEPVARAIKWVEANPDKVHMPERLRHNE